MKIDEKMSPRERLLLFSTLELLRKELAPKFSDWKDADDWLFSQLDFTKDELRQVYEGRNVMYYDGSAVDFEARKAEFAARADNDIESFSSKPISKRSLDEIIADMVNKIRGFGVDQGSGYHELNTFEVNGEEFELVAEVFKDKNEETGNSFYGVYWFVGFYDGDTLISDFNYTNSLSIDELKIILSELKNRDFTEDVKKELEQDGLSANMLLAKEEYEKYKEVWYAAHGVTTEMRAEMKEGYHQAVCHGDFDGSFEEYEQEFGYYGGVIYSCFNEFLENEFEEIKGEHLSYVNNNSVAEQLDGWWFVGHCPEAHKAMTVSVGFSHSENGFDSTEFCIDSFDKQELTKLFEGFCEENHLKDVHIQSLDIVRTACTLDELTALEEGFSSLEDKMAFAESMRLSDGKQAYKEKDELNRE